MNLAYLLAEGNRVCNADEHEYLYQTYNVHSQMWQGISHAVQCVSTDFSEKELKGIDTLIMHEVS
jgi:hypothetical protein